MRGLLPSRRQSYRPQSLWLKAVAFGLVLASLEAQPAQASEFYKQHIQPLGDRHFWRHFGPAVAEHFWDGPGNRWQALNASFLSSMSGVWLTKGHWVPAAIVFLGAVPSLCVLGYNTLAPAIDAAARFRNVPVPKFLAAVRHLQLRREWAKVDRALQEMKEKDEGGRWEVATTAHEVGGGAVIFTELGHTGMPDEVHAKIAAAEPLIAQDLERIGNLEARYPLWEGQRWLKRYRQPADLYDLVGVVGRKPEVFTEKQLRRLGDRIEKRIVRYAESVRLADIVAAIELQEQAEQALEGSARAKQWAESLQAGLIRSSGEQIDFRGVPAADILTYRDRLQQIVELVDAGQIDEVGAGERHALVDQKKKMEGAFELQVQHRLFNDATAVAPQLEMAGNLPLLPKELGIPEEALAGMLEPIGQLLRQARAEIREAEQALGRRLSQQTSLEEKFREHEVEYKAVLKEAGLENDRRFDIE